MKDIVQIQMDPANEERHEHDHFEIAATLQIGDIKVNIQNGIDKYILYIILKELNADAS
ncbi:hypothetical protein LOOC260_101110 [Paucilactobacillus hokkaidonensis JCM 18461]|uniref:Uncharacterized protein n=2 Tax=Paucilactobacillus hokkaidonensis TaxID=1193095 RepID=A0A0A1GRV2_9LACO|nr:hypothetical protein [Paucilactobacillus hokkaidonensis]BAP84690.1 hypothetical protein LOOC260_101110 [Paucilactobacillus hokkaidonensis JCM 18461]